MQLSRTRENKIFSEWRDNQPQKACHSCVTFNPASTSLATTLIKSESANRGSESELKASLIYIQLSERRCKHPHRPWAPPPIHHPLPNLGGEQDQQAAAQRKGASLTATATPRNAVTTRRRSIYHSEVQGKDPRPSSPCRADTHAGARSMAFCAYRSRRASYAAQVENMDFATNVDLCQLFRRGISRVKVGRFTRGCNKLKLLLDCAKSPERQWILWWCLLLLWTTFTSGKKLTSFLGTFATFLFFVRKYSQAEFTLGQ